MTLQRRLALTLAISAAPLLAGVAWVRTEIARRSDVQVLRDIVVSRATALGQERCEAEPDHFLEPPLPPRGERRIGPGPPGGGAEFRGRRFPPPPEGQPGPPGQPRGGNRQRFGGPFRPLQTFLYDAEFRPRSAFAPPFPEELLQSLRDGRESATSRRVIQLPGDDPARPSRAVEVLELGLRTGWSEGPCAIILARRIGPPASGESWELMLSALPLLGGLIAAVWVASGPLVRRVRSLTDAVRRSAETRYEVSVPEAGNDELTDLARAFNHAGTQVRSHVATLERRDRTLREFLANTTHDVMIPLTVLQGHLSSVQKSLAERPTDATVLVAALKEAQYMASLLHNLGAAAKLEAPEGFIQRHPVDLNALVERVVERHRPVAGPAGIELEYAVPDRPVVIDGDVTLLEQAVSNVVHNAVRYNHAGGHVGVVLDVVDGSDRGFRLRVLDDGAGVPEEKLARLTDRRYRDEAARQRDPNGLGLGLSIAREVANRHGLTLTITRSEQGGLQVEFSNV